MQHSAVHADHSSFLQEVISLKAAPTAPTLTENGDGAVDSVEVQALTQAVPLLKTQQKLLEHASELVFGCLFPDNFTVLKMAVFAVASTVHCEATVDDLGY